MSTKLEAQYPYRVRIGSQNYRVDVNEAGVFHDEGDGSSGCYSFCERCSAPGRDECVSADAMLSSHNFTLHVERGDFVAKR